MYMRFAPGQLIVRRHFQRGLLSRVWLGHVAADDDLGTWMWVASGSAYRDLGAADGRHLRQVNFLEWPTMAKTFDERPWRGQVLMLHPREGEYSSWMFLDADYRVSRYYINLELPAVRWHDAEAGLAGLDTTDYDLDVIVHPDLTWEWKDEEEFTERLAYPDIYWVDDEAAVRAEGERIIKLAEAGQFPFDGTMTDYRPDPSWPIPTEMPPGWDRPSALPAA
jgi:hypothetical protein